MEASGIQRALVDLTMYVKALMAKPNRAQAMLVRSWLRSNEALISTGLHAYLEAVIATPEPPPGPEPIPPPPSPESLPPPKRQKHVGLGLPRPVVNARAPRLPLPEEYRVPSVAVGSVKVLLPTDPNFNNVLDTCCLGRVGCIPYSFETNPNGQVYLRFLLGTKHAFKDLPKVRHRTDFGGGCKIKAGETVFECGMREFGEETGGAVPEPARKDLTLFIIGHKGRNHGMLMYKYTGPDDPPFVANKEIASIAWYSLRTVYNRPPKGIQNDGGLAHFIKCVDKDTLLALPH